MNEEEPLHFCVWCNEPAIHVCANCGKFVCDDCSVPVEEHGNLYNPDGHGTNAWLCRSCGEKILGSEFGFLPSFKVKEFKTREEDEDKGS